MCSHALVCVDLCVCDPQRFGRIREYKHGVHNVRSAPVISPLNPTAVCTVSQVKMYCKRGNSNCEHLNMITDELYEELPTLYIGIKHIYFTYSLICMASVHLV